MEIFIVSCIIIYSVSTMWYWYLLSREVKDWFKDRGLIGVWVPALFLLIFGLLGLVPLVNTVLAIHAHKHNIRNN